MVIERCSGAKRESIRVFPDPGQSFSDLLLQLVPKGTDPLDSFGPYDPNDPDDLDCRSPLLKAWPKEWDPYFNPAANFDVDYHLELVPFFKKWQQYGLEGYITGSSCVADTIVIYFPEGLDVSLRDELAFDVLVVNPQWQSWVDVEPQGVFLDQSGRELADRLRSDPSLCKEVIAGMRPYIDDMFDSNVGLSLWWD